MINEEKLSLEKCTLFLKCVGYCKALKDIWNDGFQFSSLKRRFEEMIVKEDEKKEGKDEKLITDLGECNLFFGGSTSLELNSICVPCLLKVALNKEENEEAQKEVEMALLALSCIFSHFNIGRDLFLNEMKEIIQYHEKRHNLTRLAYQSAWWFLIILSFKDQKTIEVIVDELHFEREAARELDELMQSVDWKKKEEEEIKGKGKNEELVLKRWLQMFDNFFVTCRKWNEECSGIVESIVQVLRAANDYRREIYKTCIYLLRTSAEKRVVKVDALLKSGAIDAVLEEIQQPTVDDEIKYEILQFFDAISRRLKEEEKDEKKDAKRKVTKMEMFDKLEEVGYEDVIISFHGTIDFLSKKYHFRLSLNVSDCFVNI
ncbi:uncharacterized protein MONOS_9237 [Monocercomonoides exilis]|uniref:uncharacterized protein n=1 Tax=Monocercomonoides exilis TaxID=2049356 RepID=UPI00355A5954|nr:hypothetical protein MONOS_9237 [Monocercomonoides exilis]|eukprot:MONOS_9237.1-p1 / transcript=MONOS_9237.1 / gene=MONOS_9237 / organism=Monocercomonoides_exilis_PA203 / gene_product=unspecified product / transcript_product=unspecified product / location=Mono_scaffold00373:57316-58496(-) / protein_length=374 / sequence_SO=supercontig / SO=protein_coding / is_pseudo=false